MAHNGKRQSTSYEFICSDDDEPEIVQETSKARQSKTTSGPKSKKLRISTNVQELNEVQEDSEVPDKPANNPRVTKKTSKPKEVSINVDEECIIRSQKQRSLSKSPAYEDGEIDEKKVTNMVKTFVNTFKRNPDLWSSFKNVVDGPSEELPITPISTSGGKATNTIAISTISKLPNIAEDKIHGAAPAKEDRDFLMEMKCLFLRSRNPSTSAFQQIIENIWPKYVINSAESNAYLSKAHRSFDSFRNELNKNMAALARQFIKDKSIENNSTLGKEEKIEITNYVDEAIVRKCLALCLKAVHIASLNDNEFFKTLRKFVRLCLFFHVQHIINGDDKTRYLVDVLEKVKSSEVNNLTKELQVHSLSGLDLANNVRL